MTIDWNEANRESIELFRGLLALDTTNPPGNEKIAADFLAESLAEDGLDPWIVESAPSRANLVVRLPATVEHPSGGPLLLAGHTDVVPADADHWTHPPFDAVEEDDFIFGRGAVDMKNMVAMCVMTAKLLARNDGERKRDLIVAAVADEEEGCEHGSKFLVDEHPDRVQADYMLGEVGGFFQHVNDQTYMPIMIAEKGQVHLRLRARGPTGHGSIPREDNSLVRLSRAIERLGTTRLPQHVTPVMENFIREMARTQPGAARLVLPRLLNRRLEPVILDRLLPDPELRRSFGAMLHNTVSPTIVHAGEKRNVIPGEATCDLDGRTLPGFSGADLRQEVSEVIDDPEIEIEIVSESPGVAMETPGSPLFDDILATVKKHAPDVIPLPYMVMGYTDASHFSRLGTRCYGFAPLKLPDEPDLKFSELFHGVDERVPVDGYRWGQRVLYETVETFLSR